MADPCPRCGKPRYHATGCSHVVLRCQTCPGDAVVRAPEAPPLEQARQRIAALEREVADLRARLGEAVQGWDDVHERALEAEEWLEQALTAGLHECERLRAEIARCLQVREEDGT